MKNKLNFTLSRPGIGTMLQVKRWAMIFILVFKNFVNNNFKQRTLLGLTGLPIVVARLLAESQYQDRKPLVAL